MNILVLSDSNAAGSTLLESILAHRSDGRITAYCAGVDLDVQSLRLLDENDYPTAHLRARSLDKFTAKNAPRIDAVIYLDCTAADHPALSDTPVRVQWSAPTGGSLRTTYETLLRRAKHLFALPFETMERHTLVHELDRIGTL